MKPLTWQLDIEELNIHCRGHDMDSLIVTILEALRELDPAGVAAASQLVQIGKAMLQ